MNVNIIITTYNNFEHIADTINSIKNQSFKNWSCIIVDSGSTDKTHEYTTALVAGDNRFTVFKKKNEGPSSARNFGFSKIQGLAEYVHFLDGDDMLDPDFLSILITYLNANEEVGLVGCHYNVIDSRGKFIRVGHRSRYAPGFLGLPSDLSNKITNTPFETFFSSTGQGAFAVFRTSIFKKTSGYEEEFWSHEDSDIFCQMALISEVHYLPHRLYNVRIHGHNLTRSPKANYGLFRRKWDNYKSGDANVNALIERGLKYYYTRHKPLRDFKVAIKAFGEFINTRKIEKLNWSFKCFKAGLKDIILKRSLSEVLNHRSANV